VASITSATVAAITGRAWIRQPDGMLTELRSGAAISPGSEIVTASGSSVTLTMDGIAPITIGENRNVALTDDLATPTHPGESVIRPEMTDSARLLATLESGDDPFNDLEATAAIAGGPGGDDGGGSFVRLLRILESTNPLDLTYPHPNRAEEDLTRLSGDVADTVAIAIPPTFTPPELSFEDADGTVSAGHNSVTEATGATVTGTITVSAEAGVSAVTVGPVSLTTTIWSSTFWIPSRKPTTTTAAR